MLEMYVKYLKVNKMSERTIQTYVNYVEKMNKYINKPNEEITYIDLTNWASTFSHLSPASVALAFNAIKNYFKFLKRAGLIETDPSVELKVPNNKHKEKKYLSKEDVSNIIHCASSFKNKAILYMFATTGIRFSELANITLDDYKKAINGNRQIVILGKGSKERSIYINEDTEEMVEYMLKTRPDDSCDKLFVNSTGGMVKEQSVNKMLKSASKKAGIEFWNEISPHWLRAAFATIADDNGVPIGIISKAMGHASIATTSIYVKVHQNQINAVSMDMRF